MLVQKYASLTLLGYVVAHLYFLASGQTDTSNAFLDYGVTQFECHPMDQLGLRNFSGVA